jgi:hypothetical protein
MARTIDDMIRKIQNDPDPNHTLHNELRDKAIAIILKSVGTDDWNEFMKHFVDDDPAQLARLNLKDSFSNELYIRKSVAYLVANITCGGSTPDRLNDRIQTILDIGLTSNKILADPPEETLPEETESES